VSGKAKLYGVIVQVKNMSLKCQQKMAYIVIIISHILWNRSSGYMTQRLFDFLTIY